MSGLGQHLVFPGAAAKLMQGAEDLVLYLEEIMIGEPTSIRRIG